MPSDYFALLDWFNADLDFRKVGEMTPTEESMKEANNLLNLHELTPEQMGNKAYDGLLLISIAEALDRYKAEFIGWKEEGKRLQEIEGDYQKAFQEISTLQAQIKKKNEKLQKAREALKMVQRWGTFRINGKEFGIEQVNEVLEQIGEGTESSGKATEVVNDW